ncbi:AmmeMemoRadiSam system protein A [Mobilicoccus pelagius]|uniref:AMMECR1 domain-containing protein n=1 Tax=Mobilicoccus pelagius NBRC 104925 TaxID=1089455 RepID=H5UV26_9MICO|nr:AmmeMemoRadiSam system protein A [Mobilicoccus pelagius]GAB49584.1 hypothetical protein MOPEL_130_01910 [Mobilicoccus pelagius NBRC 104925]
MTGSRESRAPSVPVPADAGDVLLPLARGAITRRLDATPPVVPESTDAAAWSADPGASFVTLHLGGRLRGCIGSLEAYRGLRDDVEDNATSAAFRDPRFPPLDVEKVDDTVIEVSVLSAPAPLLVADEGEALAALRPGIDGVILEHGRRRGTFLPQVWEQLPDPATFLAHLRAKAGLPPDFWDEDVLLSTYTVTAWEES